MYTRQGFGGIGNDDFNKSHGASYSYVKNCIDDYLDKGDMTARAEAIKYGISDEEIRVSQRINPGFNLTMVGMSYLWALLTYGGPYRKPEMYEPPISGVYKLKETDLYACYTQWLDDLRTKMGVTPSEVMNILQGIDDGAINMSRDTSNPLNLAEVALAYTIAYTTYGNPSQRPDIFDPPGATGNYSFYRLKSKAVISLVENFEFPEAATMSISDVYVTNNPVVDQGIIQAINQGVIQAVEPVQVVKAQPAIQTIMSTTKGNQGMGMGFIILGGLAALALLSR